MNSRDCVWMVEGEEKVKGKYIEMHNVNLVMQLSYHFFPHDKPRHKSMIQRPIKGKNSINGIPPDQALAKCETCHSMIWNKQDMST